jgi:anti-sigma B factor antagonist
VSALLVHVTAAQTPPTLVELAGEIDVGSVPTLRRHLRALPSDSTIVEMAGVRLLSAAGVAELVDLRDRLARVDKCLALAAARPLVRRILAVTGIGDTVLLADTVGAATDLISATGRQRAGRRPASPVRSRTGPRNPQPRQD